MENLNTPGWTKIITIQSRKPIMKRKTKKKKKLLLSKNENEATFCIFDALKITMAFIFMYFFPKQFEVVEVIFQRGFRF